MAAETDEIMIVTTDEVATGMGEVDEVVGLLFATNSLPTQAIAKLREKAAEIAADAIVGFRMTDAGDSVTVYGTAVYMCQGPKASSRRSSR
jgi:hypothetical protein